jgi:hypothetical protein
MGDMVTILSASIVEVRTGALEARDANAVAYLATIFNKSLEAASLEQRVANIEARDQEIRKALDELRRAGKQI